jgi:hypothetical protein
VRARHCPACKDVGHYANKRLNLTRPLYLTAAYLESIGSPLQHPLDYTNRILYFDSMYTAVHLTTHRGVFYLHVEQFLAFYVLIGFYRFVGTSCVLSDSFCISFSKCVNSGGPIPRRSTDHREGWRMSFI